MEDILTTEQAANNNTPVDVDTNPNCENTEETASNEPSSEGSPQKVEVTGVNLPKMKQKTKTGIILVIAILVVAIIGTIIGVKLYNEKKAEEAAIAAQEIADNYKSNLSLVSISMLKGAADAESAGNLIHSVWYNTIFEKSDSKTDKYTRPNKVSFYEDFNTSLDLLFADSDFISQINDIEANQETVTKLMKELRNPPEGYEDAYDAVKECYDVFLELTNLAISPSGSLQTFTSSFEDADSKFMKKYNSLKLYLD